MSLQITVEKVRWLAAGLLELNGCDADIAQDVAEHMIEAERYGLPATASRCYRNIWKISLVAM